MTPIQLVNGGEAFVDDSDLALVSGRRWLVNYRYSNGKRQGASHVRSGSSAQGTLVLMHRLIMSAQDGQVVDHIDGNPLNNTRANLRVCSHAENMRNRKVHRSSAVGMKGVYRDHKSLSYRAEINAGGKKHRLGSFPTAQQAHEAYLAASKKLHGAFARAA